ncbi:MAG TPA: undecaprenyldiphospho-muramoylpentapeptide beta-N-acetylglucosaminyltransferase [Candidatus Acidoferrales bacterium]|nr:undecaprenyldiphospho-muramoylpentapeptide beta-N-acetylglucosaminyltransferase [Candidatus Acidoferrales bacterium]
MKPDAPLPAKLLVTGGGTGGHVFPAIAVAREWLSRGDAGTRKREVVIVGTQNGLEARLVPEAGLPLETIRVAGLKGMRGTKFLRNLAMLGAGFKDSAAILRRHRFAAALGVGGYASGPMMLLAAMRGVPSVLFEPNLEPGFTNRVLARFATRIATGFEETAHRFGARAISTGCPVRKEFFAAEPREPRAPFHILITGGSRGALPINRAVVDTLDLLGPKKNQLFVVHQTGERDYNAVRVAYARREFNAEVSPFIGNMAEQFAQADLIVCRSGAITVAEVAAAGRAAIFIPFGAATDSHQLRNAQAMQKAGAARVIEQKDLTPQRLATEIFSLLDQPGRIQEMQQRARALARPRAVEDIVDLLEGVARP